jgi:hypothetical protein
MAKQHPHTRNVEAMTPIPTIDSQLSPVITPKRYPLYRRNPIPLRIYRNRGSDTTLNEPLPPSNTGVSRRERNAGIISEIPSARKKTPKSVALTGWVIWLNLPSDQASSLPVVKRLVTNIPPHRN